MLPFMDRLVEKTIQKSIAERVAKHKIKHVYHPDIIINREPGSGGRIVAKKLAKKLGWQLLDEALMDQLAEELNIPVDEFKNVDEHSRSWLSDTLHSIFNKNYISDVRYINHLKRVIAHAAKKGDLVIVGRGANHILPPEKCLNVRITASLATRIENTFKYEGKKTKVEAESWVRKIESERHRFIRQYFGKNPYNPWYYDLVISTDHLTLDQAVDLTLQAYLAKFPKEKRRLSSLSL
ncbi:hypothetical protein DCC61_04225 [Candidatus Microgenomates bacterium]|nr:cytidylate kinase-like family protein [Candidatus Microgenomates bacterium CPR3]RIK50911.1 MAG: hypothetical protein DCC61_04225 [Candidatus Microgenomates bacterium]